MVQLKHYDIPLDALVSHYRSVRPIDWKNQFGQDHPLDVEIGFGLGEFLIQTAQQFPGRNIVGIEQEWARAKKALRKIDSLRKEATIADALDNIRILRMDAVVAFERLFCPATIQKIYCLFPCPWPKKKHVKHRLFSQENFKLFNSRLVDGGEVQIVTDYHPYFHWIFEQIDGTGFEVTTNTIQPQFNTKFELKWREEGQKEFFELKLQKKKHIDIPVREDVELKVYFLKEFNPERFQFENVTGNPAVIFRNSLFDSIQKRGMFHLVVSEENITQHLWLEIVPTPKGWRLAKAEGHLVLPTAGVARAIGLVYEAVKNTQGS